MQVRLQSHSLPPYSDAVRSCQSVDGVESLVLSAILATRYDETRLAEAGLRLCRRSLANNHKYADGSTPTTIQTDAGYDVLRWHTITSRDPSTGETRSLDHREAKLKNSCG